MKSIRVFWQFFKGEFPKKQNPKPPKLLKMGSLWPSVFKPKLISRKIKVAGKLPIFHTVWKKGFWLTYRRRSPSCRPFWKTYRRILILGTYTGLPQFGLLYFSLAPSSLNCFGAVANHWTPPSELANLRLRLSLELRSKLCYEDHCWHGHWGRSGFDPPVPLDPLLGRVYNHCFGRWVLILKYMISRKICVAENSLHFTLCT